MNVSSRSSFYFDFFSQKYNTKKYNVEYFDVLFQYEITERFLFAMLVLLVKITA